MKSVPKSLAFSLLVVCSVIAALSLAGGAVAQVITIDLVTVGNPGNPADPSLANTGGGDTYGAVAYSYDIGKYEVTNTQYAAFLTATAATDTFSLYNTAMGSSQFGGITQSGSSGSFAYAVKSGFGNKAVNYVSFWDAARFANWLNNGQGGGSTETGSYALTSDGILANTVTRNGGANWVVASENEWYKAAYYDPTKGGTGGYWLYPTKSDILGDNTAFSATNGANYNDGDYAVFTGSNDGALPVGSYANAASYYGTFDQGGNLREWNETIISGTTRGVRGGSWDGPESNLRSSDRGVFDPTIESVSLGFRVASLAPIPEPSTYAAALGGVALGFAAYRRRRRQAG